MAYGDRDDLYALGLPSSALTGISTTIQDSALEAGASLIDSYLRKYYGTPFPEPVPEELKRANCVIAGWDLLTTRGFNPQSENEAIRLRYEDTLKWLRDISMGVVKLDDSADSTSEQECVPLIYSDDPINWDL